MTIEIDPDEDARARRRELVAEALYSRLVLPGLRIKTVDFWPSWILGSGGKLKEPWRRRLHLTPENGVGRTFGAYFVVEWCGTDDSDVADAYCERATTRERLGYFRDI